MEKKEKMKNSYSKPVLKIHGDLKEKTEAAGQYGGDVPIGSHY